jgi:DNA-binding IclR family transcriptional regulator
MTGPVYTLRTLQKGLAVLETLEQAGELSVTELSRRLGESPTVIFRILKTLEDRGYIQQDATSKRYGLGLRIWEIGSRAVRRSGLTDHARPVLKWLTEVTGETSDVAVVRGTDVVYVEVVQGVEPLRVYVEPGLRSPLYLTASGKAILAHRGPDLFKRVVAAGLNRITPATITTATALRRRLDQIRRTGASIIHGEQRPHISAVAAPIFDRAGECVAAVGAFGPSLRFQGEELERITGSVRKAAEEISARLQAVQ